MNEFLSVEQMFGRVPSVKQLKYFLVNSVYLLLGSD